MERILSEESSDMENIAARKFKRKGTKRSRAGCLTCKIRRVKCGEERPGCQRCTSTGRKCDGYIEIVSKQNFDIVPYGYRLITTSTKTPLTASQSSIPGTPQEQQCLDFFRTKSVTDLSGFFRCEFWNRLILQVSHVEPAIRHAAISLAALQQSSQVSGIHSYDMILKREFAFQQYNKAIRHLAQYISIHKDNSTDVALMSCLLFFAFESFQGRFVEARQHLQSGLNITFSIQYKESQSHLQDITQVFRRVAVQSSFFGLDVPPQLFERGRLLGKPFDFKDIPLSSLENARQSLYSRIFDTNKITQKATPLNSKTRHAFIKVSNAKKDRYLEPPSLAEQGIAKSRLVQWSKEFQIFMNHSKDTLSGADFQAAAMLQVHYEFALIALSMSTNNDEMCFDKYNSNFSTIVQLSETVILSSIDSSPLVKFSLGPGILAPLHFVNMKCRDPKIRRKALHLIEISPFRESLWNTNVLLAMGRRVIEIEEGCDSKSPNDFCGVIPVERRLFLVVVELESDERSGVMHILRKKEMDEVDDSESFTELITW